MHIEWNRVTWYSKTIAIVLFVGTFILGLYLGGQYQKIVNEQVLLEKTVPTTEEYKSIKPEEKVIRQVERKQIQQTPVEKQSESKNITPENLGYKIGDRLGDFVLTDFIGNYVSSDETLSESAKLITYFARFTGTTDINGVMEENEMLGMWCFKVSERDYTKIPRLKYDNRNPWFCFKNPNDIPKDARTSTEEQKIQISEYELNFVAKGSSDITTFVKMVK